MSIENSRLLIKYCNFFFKKTDTRQNYLVLQFYIHT